jgi:uncharacterized protein YjdB
MLTLTPGESKTLRAEFTHQGQPARVDPTPPVWGVSNPAVATVTPSADGMTAVITAVGAGDTQATLTATAGGVAIVAVPLDVQVALPLADSAAIVVV